MKRLIANNNNSIEQYIEIEKQIEDDTLKSRYLRQQATTEYVTAKKVINFLPVAPTNDLIYKVYNYFLNGVVDVNTDFNDLCDIVLNKLQDEGIVAKTYNRLMPYKNINEALTGN